MNTSLECFPCFLRQTIIALRQHGNNHETEQHVLREVLCIMQNADITKPPAYTTTFIHRSIRAATGSDPFAKIKTEFNKTALSLYDDLKDLVRKSDDPVKTASRLAIAGNIIDFGIFTNIDIDRSIKLSLCDEIATDDYKDFRDDIENTVEILYLLDNAGEIVFDRLLIEELVLLGKKVTAVVKGYPILNDVTLDDAVQTGLDKICNVIDNGSDAVGTILPWTSSEFRKKFDNAELIISKGQGNFETLSGTPKRIYYLFQSKCEVVSRELGLPVCAMLLKKT